MKIIIPLISIILLSSFSQANPWNWNSTYDYLNRGQDKKVNDDVTRLTTRESSDGSIVNINADQYLELYLKVNTLTGSARTAAEEELSKNCVTANNNNNTVSTEACMNGAITSGTLEYRDFVASINHHQPRINTCLTDFNFNQQYKESNHDDIRDSAVMNATTGQRGICNEYGSFNHINKRIILDPSWTKTNNGSSYGYDNIGFNISTSNSNNRVRQVFNATCFYLNNALGTNLHHSSLCQYVPNNFTNEAGSLCGSPTSNYSRARQIWPGLTETYEQEYRSTCRESYRTTCRERLPYRIYKAPSCNLINGTCSGGGWVTRYVTYTVSCTKRRTVSCTKTRQAERVKTGTFSHTNSNIPAVCHSRSGANSITLRAPEPNMDTYRPNKNGKYAILGSIYQLHNSTDDFVKNRMGLTGCVSNTTVRYHDLRDQTFYKEKRTINPIKYERVNNILMIESNMNKKSVNLPRCYR